MKERSKFLTDFCDTTSKEKNKEYIGKKYTVLVTEKGKNNTFVGRAANYKPVVLKEGVKIGEFISIEIEDSTSTYLVGKLI